MLLCASLLFGSPAFPQDGQSGTPDHIDISDDIRKHTETIRRACDDSKNLVQRINTINEGANGLRTLAEKYLDTELRYRIGTTARLDLEFIDHMMTSGMVFTEELTLLRVETYDFHDRFMTYYAVMFNLEDDFRPQDIRMAWAKNMERGLACLYGR